ncbi:MAG: DUF3108 domain-containing protein [Pseudomonadota bacterium]
MPLRSLSLVLLLAVPAAAEETIRFDVGLRGLTAAQIALTGRQDGDDYAVSARMASTGLVSVISDFAFAAEARGRMRGRQPAPVEARLRDDMGRNRGSVVLRYSGGVPMVERVPEREPDPWDIDPADQRGRADPISVVWAAFRTRPAADICNVTLRAFDGRRSGDLVLGPRRAQADGTVTCAGEWVRVAGYDPEDMAERTRFPFTLTWRPEGEALRLVELRAASRYGDAVLRRR